MIRRADVRRHIWGDREAGLVADWLYASTDKLHVMEFGLGPHRWFRHSPSYRTVFGADEVFYVLEGSAIVANPETGEVVEANQGEWIFFRKDTWHHVHARGSGPLRVLEFFSPPPATGSSGPYARTRPYVDSPTYRRDHLLGSIPGGEPTQTLHRVRRDDLSLRLEGQIIIGLVASTEHLTVAMIEADPGAQGESTSHGGDALIYGVLDRMHVRTFWESESVTYEIEPGDAVFLPEGCAYELFSYGEMTRAILGVSPSYTA